MFSMSIEQASLMKALSYLEFAIGKQTPWLMMNTESTGIVQMFTTDNNQFAVLNMITSSGQSQHEDCPILDFKKFKAIVSTIPATEFVDVVDNGNGVDISYGIRRPTKLNGINAQRPQKVSPIMPSSNEITIPVDAMIKISQNASIIVDNDSSATPIFSCMHVSTDQLNVIASAYDATNKRIFCQTVQSALQNPKQQYLLEAQKVLKVAKTVQPFFDTLVVNKDAALIKIEPIDIKNGQAPWFSSLVYYVRQVVGNYPTTIAKMFKVMPNEFAEVNCDEVMMTLNKVKAIHENIAGAASTAIDLHLYNDLMEINYSSTYGEVADEIALENQVSFDITAKMNYQKLADIVKGLNSKTIYIGEPNGSPGNYIIRNDLSNANTAMFMVAGLSGVNTAPPKSSSVNTGSTTSGNASGNVIDNVDEEQQDQNAENNEES